MARGRHQISRVRGAVVLAVLIFAPAARAQAQNPAEQAKTAKLTPIVPSPSDITKPAFQLYAEIDLPVLGVGLVFGASRLFQTNKAFCAPQCDPAELNPIDRLTAGWWSPGWSTASDIGILSVAAAAGVLLVADEGPLPALNDAVVVAESALSTLALGSMMTLATGRPRPFLYGTQAPLSERNSSNAAFSYISSHTSITAAVATSTFVAMHRRHPHSALPAVVLGVGLAATVFVGTARVAGGDHFISDAVAGGIVGISLGYLIPSLHLSPVAVVPTVTPTTKGISLVGPLPDP